MDWELISQKLESLRRCVLRIEAKCPATPAALASDPDAQDILALNLTRAVQLCVDVAAHIVAQSEAAPPHTMGEVFDRLSELAYLPPELADRMKKAVGFRNIAIHNYEAMNWEIVHAIATQRLSDFDDFAKAVATPR